MGHAFTDIEQLTPGCPYADWARPNIHWCEHNLCAYVAAPSNAWSNLFYLVFAYFMWRDARAMRSPTLAMFGNAAFCTGACSFVYHATYTLVGQFFDFVGMFIFVNLGITLNLRRFGYFPAWRTARLFYRSSVAVCSGAVVACYYARLPYQALIALLVAVALGQEVVLFARARRRAAAAEDRAARGKPRARAYWLYVSMCFMALGLTCSVLDGLRVWCDPDDHIVQGHSLWHMLTARSTVASISRCSSFFFRGGAPDLTHDDSVLSPIPSGLRAVRAVLSLPPVPVRPRGAALGRSHGEHADGARGRVKQKGFPHEISHGCAPHSFSN